MTINGKVSAFEYESESVRGLHHKPVIRSYPIQETAGVWPLGLIVTRDTATKELLQYATDGPADWLGVMDEEVDLTAGSSGVVIVHGSVKKDALKVGADTKAAPSDSLVLTLEDRKIYTE